MLTVKSAAKINLFLEIKSKRPDGFHEIETIMHEIDLYDQLDFSPNTNGEITLDCQMPEIPTNADNLVFKAALLLKKATNCQMGAQIRIHKQIPAGGGLGGGSGNAAAALIALNKIWELQLDKQTLHEIATRLGSDIPFFLYGGTCTCRGRGEIITELPRRHNFQLLLIMPEWKISTAKAYASLAQEDMGKNSMTPFLVAWQQDKLIDPKKYFFNRFENSVFKLESRQKKLFEKLQEMPFTKVLMSGSGSTFYAVIPTTEQSNYLRREVSKLPGVSNTIIVGSKTE